MDIQLDLVIESRIYREGISAYLKPESSIFVRQTFTSLDQALQNLEQFQDDVVIVDSHFGNLLPSIHRMKQSHSNIKIILMAFGFEISVVRTCITAGVEGFITNNDSMQDLKNCIIAVNSGHLCYPSAFTKLMADGVSSATNPMLAKKALGFSLTARQTRVLELIENGFSNKEIARKLNIQTATVKNHVHQILERLKVKNRCEAASVYRRSTHEAPLVI